MGKTIIRPGDRITASIPGIARDFEAEIVEIKELANSLRGRVYVRALEPVIGFTEPELLYEAGSLIWLTMNAPEGFIFDEDPEKNIPPMVGYMDKERK